MLVANQHHQFGTDDAVGGRPPHHLLRRINPIVTRVLADLMTRGVQVELCGATAKAHHWGNADLLPGIKVNTDAMARTTQLVQQGFVKITEE